MDNNDSNIKPQQTGGLKLMTVFIAVLALHVVVIGGFAVYHLMSGGGSDADVATTDKTHKSADSSAVATGTLPDANQAEKTAPAAAPAEVASIPQAAQAASSPANTPAIAPTQTTAPVAKTTPALAPMLTPPASLALTAPKSATLAPPAEVATPGPQTPSGPIAPELAPPAEPAPVTSAPIVSGPVHMPPPSVSSPTAPKIEREHGQTYVVKITDSYKKIALAHHVTVAQLKAANHIKDDTLHTGQKLIIPSSKTAVAENAPTPVKGVNTSLTRSVLSEPAPASTASLAAAPSSTASQHHLYTVVKGDTLVKIAHKFKTTPSAILAANSIANPAKLTVGKKLKIPSQESRSARSITPSSPAPAQVQQAKEKEDAPSGQLANFVP